MRHSDSPSAQRTDTLNREVRAAMDVMFEALSHIHSSLEAQSEEEREESYRNFKEALYDRFEHLMEEKYDDNDSAPSGHPLSKQVYEVLRTGKGEPAPSQNEDANTLKRLWPAVAESRNGSPNSARAKPK